MVRASTHAKLRSGETTATTLRLGSTTPALTTSGTSDANCAETFVATFTG